MPTFTIDGREIEVPAGWTILQAAQEAGIEIPHYCYHPGLSIAGNCRICLVEVEKFPKPAIACNTQVTEGMVVFTDNDKVREWREAIMEFLLVNHPLDCPICDQAGECKLQEFSYKHGHATTRFVEEKEHGPKARELGPHVVFDWERCIKCTRCIRFCDEVAGTGELDMFLRGVREEIGVFPGKPLANPYSGNVVDLCPVGALTLKEFRFRSRVWFLQDVPSTCGGCARGCSIDIGEFRNEIYRITPRENEAVNRFWICDEGRLWGETMKAASERRIAGPSTSAGEATDPWGAALNEAAELLQSHARGGKVRVLASPRATLEDTWLLASLAKNVLGGATVHLASHESGEDDHLLIRADKTPNARGARLVLEAVCGEVHDTASLESALGAGEVELLLAVGPGLVGPVDGETPPLSADALGKAGQIIAIDAFASPLSDAAQVVLSAASFGEVSGSYVNFAGRVQRVERALLPTADARPLSMILADLYAQLSIDAPAPGPMEIGAKLSETVPALADIDWEALPASTGQNIAGVDAAADAAPATGALVQMLAARDAAPAGTGD